MFTMLVDPRRTEDTPFGLIWIAEQMPRNAESFSSLSLMSVSAVHLRKSSGSVSCQVHTEPPTERTKR